jgi:hypothetical protein
VWRQDAKSMAGGRDDARVKGVAYLGLADNVSRPLPYRLRRLNQAVMRPPNWFSIPRSTLLSSIGAHASRSLARSSTGILF